MTIYLDLDWLDYRKKVRGRLLELQPLSEEWHIHYWFHPTL